MDGNNNNSQKFGLKPDLAEAISEIIKNDEMMKEFKKAFKERPEQTFLIKTCVKQVMKFVELKETELENSQQFLIKGNLNSIVFCLTFKVGLFMSFLFVALQKHGVLMRKGMKVKLFDEDYTPIENFEKVIRQYSGCSSFHIKIVIDGCEDDEELLKEVKHEIKYL